MMVGAGYVPARDLTINGRSPQGCGVGMPAPYKAVNLL